MLELTGFRYCPACGSNSLVNHAQKAMLCTACRYTYFHNTASAVAAIIEIDSKLLLTVRAWEPKAGMYDLPGGFVDYGESAETACKREILEELGVAITITSYLGSFPNSYTFGSTTYKTTDLFFICRLVDDAATIVTSSEIEGWELFDRGSIPFDRLGFESNRSGLQYYCSLYENEK